jgi:hypothetical protein
MKEYMPYETGLFKIADESTKKVTRRARKCEGVPFTAFFLYEGFA